jgi:hypothetical protein
LTTRSPAANFSFQPNCSKPIKISFNNPSLKSDLLLTFPQEMISSPYRKFYRPLLVPTLGE